MQKTFPAVEFTVIFKKWHVWTEMAGESRYPIAGSFNKTRLDLVKEIIQTRKMDKQKEMTSALVSETVMGMMVLGEKGGTVPAGSFPCHPSLYKKEQTGRRKTSAQFVPTGSPQSRLAAPPQSHLVAVNLVPAGSVSFPIQRRIWARQTSS
jgi:hypothetical protein